MESSLPLIIDDIISCSIISGTDTDMPGFLQSFTLPTALPSVPLPSSSRPSNKRLDPNLAAFSLNDYERRTDLDEQCYVIWIRHHEEVFVGVKVKSMDGCHTLLYSVIPPMSACR